MEFCNRSRQRRDQMVVPRHAARCLNSSCARSARCTALLKARAFARIGISAASC
jgi:hypothetical protein